MQCRRDFLKTTAAAGVLGLAGCTSSRCASTSTDEYKDFMWVTLLHMGTNMWQRVSDYLNFDLDIWHEHTYKLHEIGMNMIIIDLGEALVYPSHPELAVKGSWMPERLKEELQRLKRLGLEPIPKLNFSACHDAWLKEYGRMVSTEPYYRVCADLIRDVSTIFDKPRFFHLGFDEETAPIQANYDYIVVRQGDLWWHDALFLIKEVEKNGSRAMMWSDPAWAKKDYTTKMPKSLLTCNGFYWNETESMIANGWKSQVNDGRDRPSELKTFITLEKAGFDQLPCVSNFYEPDSMESVIRFCKRHISPAHFKGILFAPWGSTHLKARFRTDASIPLQAKIRKEFASYAGFGA